MVTKFSPKQKLVMNWWRRKKFSRCDAIICDGAVRSGKTLSMSAGFVMWALKSFDGGTFAMCGKTITSLRRNVIVPLLPFLKAAGFTCTEKLSENRLDISLGGRTDRFYLFGGRDESSAALLQGITLSGVFLDEVALMPRSFVEQALARCSVSGSRMWFNCNPDQPSHWFYREWIKKADEKNALYLHFTMDDNPSLAEEVKERYRKLYSGVFYERFVLGRWTAPEGLVYPMFDPGTHIYTGAEPECERYVISCDYGTVNPSSFGLWGLHKGVWHRVKEYYYSSKKEGVPRTDEEHYAALEELAGSRDIERVVVDPSAASFIECIRRHNRFKAARAENDVVTGIRRTGAALKQNRLRIHESCRDIIREFGLYCWNEKAGTDVPVKENDHAISEIDGGIKKEVSISCSASKRRCSVCGCDKSVQSCSHVKGRSYNGKVCHIVLDGITDAYEWSFVAVPAQVNAGVTKRFTDDSAEKSAACTTGESESSLRREIRRLAFISGGKGAAAAAEVMARSMNAAQLAGMVKSFERLAGHGRTTVQLSTEAESEQASQFKL